MEHYLIHNTMLITDEEAQLIVRPLAERGHNTQFTRDCASTTYDADGVIPEDVWDECIGIICRSRTPLVLRQTSGGMYNSIPQTEDVEAIQRANYLIERSHDRGHGEYIENVYAIIAYATANGLSASETLALATVEQT